MMRTQLIAAALFVAGGGTTVLACGSCGGSKTELAPVQEKVVMTSSLNSACFMEPRYRLAPVGERIYTTRTSWVRPAPVGELVVTRPASRTFYSSSNFCRPARILAPVGERITVTKYRPLRTIKRVRTVTVFNNYNTLAPVGERVIIRRSAFCNPW